MGKPISVDLRQRVCQAVQEGLFCRQAAARFKISASSAIRWVSLLSAEGSFAPRPQGGDRKSGRIEAQAAFILARVAETPDVTLAELQTLLSTRGLDVGIGTLWRAWRAPGASAVRALEHNYLHCGLTPERPVGTDAAGRPDGW